MSGRGRPMSAQQAIQIQRQIDKLQHQLAQTITSVKQKDSKKEQKKSYSASDVMKYISDPSGTIPVYERLDNALKKGGVAEVNAEINKIYDETYRFTDGNYYSNICDILTRERNDGNKSYYLSTRKFIWNIWECLLRNKYKDNIPRMVICAFACLESECYSLKDHLYYDGKDQYCRDNKGNSVPVYSYLYEALNQCLMSYRAYYQRICQLCHQRKPPAFIRIKGRSGNVREYTVSLMDKDVNNILSLLIRPFQK